MACCSPSPTGKQHARTPVKECTQLLGHEPLHALCNTGASTVLLFKQHGLPSGTPAGDWGCEQHTHMTHALPSIRRPGFSAAGSVSGVCNRRLRCRLNLAHSVERDQDGPAARASCWRVLPAHGPPRCCLLQLPARGWCGLFWLCAIADLDDEVKDSGHDDVLHTAGQYAHS